MLLEQYIYSAGKGFILGGSLCFLSLNLDTTVAYKSFKKMKKYHPQLYFRSVIITQANLMVVSPVMYGMVDTTMLKHTTDIEWFNIFATLMIHCIGYYGVHYSMHKVKWLYQIHKFHHEFDRLLLPSVGNSVSIMEFCLAYMLPFIVSAYILEPNEFSFVVPITIIALLNMAIHTQELEHVPWVRWLVSPREHILHHKKRNKHYAAPTLNIDYLLGQN